MSRRIRVLVVEDSLTIRRFLCDVVARDPELELVGEAEDGKQAIEQCVALRPDVITLDMIMPVMSGVTATEYLMAHRPTPILIVSSSTNRGELFKTYDALAAGAVDVLEKPRCDEPADSWARVFLSTIKMVSRIRVITHLRGLRSPARSSAAPLLRPDSALVAIGASTGGPGALVEILRNIPTSFTVPILIVQHISDPFGVAFAEWLDRQSQHRVAIARDGEPVASGNVLFAPSGSHLTVVGKRIKLTNAAERHSCRPSIDVLFESVAAVYGPAVTAGLLTGMGRDGAAGLLAIRLAGGTTIAQDEATCVVYGMPREAVALGAAMRILPLGEIGPALAASAGRQEAT